MMAFEGKMTTGDKVNIGIGHIALEGIGSGRDERRVILKESMKILRKTTLYVPSTG